MSKKELLLKDGVGSVAEYLAEVESGGNIDALTGAEIASMIDHTLLKPEATRLQIEELCEEAVRNNFKSVCVNPYWVSTARKTLNGSYVKVCTVIGFPLGATLCTAKAAEAAQAVKAGAAEVDMVLNIGAMKSRDYNEVKKDVETVVEAAGPETLVKVILETCLLTDEEIAAASKLCAEGGADYVKTSTGFSTGGATVEAVKIMREAVGNELGVKASGGVRSLEDMITMVKTGATRIGTSSGVEIIAGNTAQTDY